MITEWLGETKKAIPWRVHRGDINEVLANLDKNRFQCVVTSPPYYWQRDYKVDGQIGLEPTIDGYVEAIADSMKSVRRVLKDDGLLFLNLGDTYYSAKGLPKGTDAKSKARRFGLRAVDASGLGVPRKTTIGIPWRVALRMISDGWILRSPIVWERSNGLPEPTAKDRPWRSYEFLFMFSKKPRYKFFRTALGGSEDVWRIPVKPNSSKGLHNAAFPEALARKAIDCSTEKGDEVLDPFAGTGTTLTAAVNAERPAFGIDLNYQFCEFSAKRLGAI
ncbi:DNA-methyltransferase [Kumtagia ephedrae]|uniref:Methyltransferase n=1 Tax=Kumtagia ephedrae TaxID=2116701 RepID=A0A2P7S1J6_9HYPH|nr:site-specific DNA-methyltransferase [Mesorhizobium ephedrae]PSJ56348.1 site-specific DNA-methyltransferase [Mesorhizobium ephedrae]